MTELVKKYQAAPRQRSPERLDNLILSRAAHEMRVQRPASTLFSPWKAMAVSFSVAGLGVALLLRNGVPPLNDIAESDVADLSRDRSVVMDRASDAVSASAEEESVLHHRDDFARQSTMAGSDLKQKPGLELPEEHAELAAGLVSTETTKTTASASAPVLRTAPVAVESAAVVELAPDSVPVEVADTHAQPAGNESPGFAFTDSDAENAVAAVNPEKKVAEKTSSLRESQLLKQKRSRDSADNAALISDPDSTPASSQVTAAQSAAPNRLDLGESPERLTGAAANNWLLEQFDNRFTLQLATADDVDYLVRFGSTLKLPPPRYVVHLKTNQNDGFVLLSGLFETFEAATLHLENLSPAARQFKPRVRNLGVLKRELATP